MERERERERGTSVACLAGAAGRHGEDFGVIGVVIEHGIGQAALVLNGAGRFRRDQTFVEATHNPSAATKQQQQQQQQQPQQQSKEKNPKQNNKKKRREFLGAQLWGASLLDDDQRFARADEKKRNDNQKFDKNPVAGRASSHSGAALKRRRKQKTTSWAVNAKKKSKPNRVRMIAHCLQILEIHPSTAGSRSIERHTNFKTINELMDAVGPAD